MPSLTFVATANILRALGAKPVFVDVTSLGDLNADIAAIEKAITPRTKAICITHFGGYPLDMERLKNVAGNIPIIEDCAHSPGAETGAETGAVSGDVKTGASGRVGCFSFFSNKNITTGEGGMITTNDGALADRVRLIRSHGMTATTMDRHYGRATDYDVIVPGYNYRMDEMRAALGSTQLARLEERNAQRGALSKRYAECLNSEADLVVPFIDAPGKSAYHLQTVILPQHADRAVIRENLKADGIQTSVHYPPIHLFTAYRTVTPRSLPLTEEVGQRILTLPLYPKLEIQQVDWVSKRLIAAIEALAAK